MATVTGAALALGVQWIASKSGKELEPFILSGSLFVFGACVTLFYSSNHTICSCWIWNSSLDAVLSLVAKSAY